MQGVAIRQAWFVVAETSAWLALLSQGWAAAFPNKQRRKNTPTNSVRRLFRYMMYGARAHSLRPAILGWKYLQAREVRAALVEAAAAMAGTLGPLADLLKKRSGDVGNLKPAAVLAPPADLGAGFEHKVPPLYLPRVPGRS